MKLDLALLSLKVILLKLPLHRLHKESPLLKHKIKLLKKTLNGMELSKSPIIFAIDDMNNQLTATDNDSEECKVNVNTSMDSLPSAKDNNKQNLLLITLL
jgi:hypothetical protein